MLNTTSCHFDDTLYITFDLPRVLKKRTLSQDYSCSCLYQHTTLQHVETRIKKRLAVPQQTCELSPWLVYYMYYALNTVNGICEVLWVSMQIHQSAAQDNYCELVNRYVHNNLCFLSSWLSRTTIWRQFSSSIRPAVTHRNIDINRVSPSLTLPLASVQHCMFCISNMCRDDARKAWLPGVR